MWSPAIFIFSQQIPSELFMGVGHTSSHWVRVVLHYVIDRRRSVHFVNIRQQLLETKRGELMDNLVKVCLLESKTSFFFFFLSAKKFGKMFNISSVRY